METSSTSCSMGSPLTTLSMRFRMLNPKDTGRHVIVVYDRIDEDTIRVITAYEVPEPEDGG